MTGAIRTMMRRDRRFGLVVRVRASAGEMDLAAATIDASRIAVRLEAELEAARINGAGRQRQLPVRTLLAGLLALALAGQPLHVRRAYELLVNLPAATRRRYDIERPDGTTITERQVAYLFRRICRVLDFSPHTAVRIDQDTRSARRALTQSLMDDLLAATLPADRPSGSYALDATTVAAWARGFKSPARRRDHDAGWSVKTADGSTKVDAAGGTDKPRRTPGRRHDSFVFGYDTHLFTWTADDDTTEHIPALTERIVVFGGGRSDIDLITATATDLFTHPAAAQPAGGDLLVDRWYSQQDPARFHLPVRGAGAQLVMDYKSDQTGPDGTYRGTLKVDGQLYCPALPPGLHDLPPAHYKNTTQLAAREAVAARRDPYRMLPLSAPDPAGAQRVQCPAERGKLRCPLKPASLARPAATTQTVATPPISPPACCTQKTLTVPGDVSARMAQRHPWGSTAWRNSYGRRNVVEGAIGVLKTAGGGDVKRDHIRLMGIVAHSLMMTFAVAASNLRLLGRHLQRQDAAEAATATADSSSATTIDDRAFAPAHATAPAANTGADPPAA